MALFSLNGVNVKMIAIQLLMVVIKLMLMIVLAVPMITKLVTLMMMMIFVSTSRLRPNELLLAAT